MGALPRPSVPPGLGEKGKRKMRREWADSPHCSLRPHDKTVVPQCAQLSTTCPPHPIGFRRGGVEEKKGKKGGLAIPCARATRGLRRPSLDARMLGKRQTAPSSQFLGWEMEEARSTRTHWDGPAEVKKVE